MAFLGNICCGSLTSPNCCSRGPEQAAVKAACDDVGAALIAYSPLALGVNVFRPTVGCLCQPASWTTTLLNLSTVFWLSGKLAICRHADWKVQHG